MQDVGSIISHMLDRLGIENAVKLKFLRKNWKKIFDSPVCNHTFPKDLKKSVLIVVVDSNSWLNELILIKNNFLNKLHKFGIEDIEFKYGRIPQKNALEKAEKKISLEISEEEWIGRIVSNFKDTEMRESIEKILKKYFVYKKQGVKNGRI